jgi:hypothetical protein
MGKGGTGLSGNGKRSQTHQEGLFSHLFGVHLSNVGVFDEKMMLQRPGSARGNSG